MGDEFLIIGVNERGEFVAPFVLGHGRDLFRRIARVHVAPAEFLGKLVPQGFLVIFMVKPVLSSKNLVGS